MNGVNLIVLFNRDATKVLLCRRMKNPYIGKFNFIGGHIETGESGEDAAYRELSEETAIPREFVNLRHLMDFTYFNQNCRVEVWCGKLKADFEVHGEENPLLWVNADCDFFDMDKYAGEGNMGHIMEQIRQFGDGFVD